MKGGDGGLWASYSPIVPDAGFPLIDLVQPLSDPGVINAKTATLLEQNTLM